MMLYYDALAPDVAPKVRGGTSPVGGGLNHPES